MTEIVENRLNCLVGRVRKVRRWLVTLAILKVAALCLIFVSAYVGIYAWLDHRLHFDSTGRIIALGLLIAGIVLLLSRLTRALLGHISCSGAANYIEDKRSFDQQLVTAVEYYEKKDDYPYSEVLAEHLVMQVDKDSEEFDFDSTVRKWLGYIFSAVIIFGLIVAGSYIHQTGLYFYSYFARLTRPLATIAPLPATTLEAITEDIVAEPDSQITLAAAIKGRVPESGNFVLTVADANTTGAVTGEPAGLTSQIEPAYDERDEPKFEVTRTFTEPAQLRYRFEAGPAASDWHKINICNIPKIKNIKAKVTLGDSRYIKPYEQQVKDYTLEVAKDSFVTLTVETTEPIDKAAITNLFGKTEARELKGTNKFEFKFVASRKGFIELALSSAQGVTNEKIPPVQILMKPDQAPQFKLISPDGDYLATNVASVPITFEITDDYALDSGKLYLELASGQTEALPIPVKTDGKTTVFTHTLELEQQDLGLGDSIMFYAGATDVDTSTAGAKGPSSSDMYFIEIRPYRQLWHQIKPKMPGGAGKQGLDGGERQILETLLGILEYTRAIVKKTWTIANKPKLEDQDRSRLGSINKDLDYCTEQLTIIRDLRYRADAASKATLDEVLDYYAQAGELLGRHDAFGALTPEKQAYRTLRKFVLELEKALMLGGGGSIPPRRDHVKMEERVHVTRYEKERIEWELKELAQKLAELAAEQKRLKKEFENFLRQQQKKKLAQETTDQQSWTAKNEKPSQGKPCSACGGSDPNSCPVCSQTSVDGALPPPSQAQASGSGQGTSGSTASSQQRMQMLQAKQRALQEEVAQLKQSLEELQKMSDADQAQGQQQAQEHLDKAMEEMAEFRSKLADAQYGAGKDDTALAQAAQELDQAAHELNEAIDALENQFPLTEQEELTKQAQELAEELAEIAEALDSSVKGVEREQMLARLEQAKQMLEQIMNQQFQPAEGQADAQGQGQENNSGDAAQTGGGPFAVAWGDAGLPSSIRLAPAHAARFMARQFWSIAIKAKRRDRQLIEDESADVEFRQMESEFFEKAAGYEPLAANPGRNDSRARAPVRR